MRLFCASSRQHLGICLPGARVPSRCTHLCTCLHCPRGIHRVGCGTYTSRVTPRTTRLVLAFMGAAIWSALAAGASLTPGVRGISKSSTSAKSTFSGRTPKDPTKIRSESPQGVRQNRCIQRLEPSLLIHSSKSHLTCTTHTHAHTHVRVYTHVYTHARMRARVRMCTGWQRAGRGVLRRRRPRLCCRARGRGRSKLPPCHHGHHPTALLEPVRARAEVLVAAVVVLFHTNSGFGSISARADLPFCGHGVESRLLSHGVG